MAAIIMWVFVAATLIVVAFIMKGYFDVIKSTEQRKGNMELTQVKSALASAKATAEAANRAVAELEKHHSNLVSKEIKPWSAKSDEKCYVLTGDGSITSSRGDVANGYWKFGSVFKKKESAEKAAKKRGVLNTLDRLAARLNKGWKADFSNDSQKKYFLFYDHAEGKVRCNYADDCNRFGLVYFKDLSTAFNAYKALSSEDKKVFRTM